MVRNYRVHRPPPELKEPFGRLRPSNFLLILKRNGLPTLIHITIGNRENQATREAVESSLSQELSFQGEQAGEETSTLYKPRTLARLCPTAYASALLLFCFKPFPNEGGNCKDHRKRGEVVRMKPRCYDAQPHRKQEGSQGPTRKTTRFCV